MTTPACHKEISVLEIYTAHCFIPPTHHPHLMQTPVVLTQFGAHTVQKMISGNEPIGSTVILFTTRFMYKINYGDLEPYSIRKIIEFILIYISGPFNSEAISK